MRRPFDWASGPNALLSATGVEFAIVVALVMLKIMNIVEMFVSVLVNDATSRRAWLQFVAVAVFTASAVALLSDSLRAGRLRPYLVTVDVAVGLAVLLAAPTFAPRATTEPWTDWPVAVTFLVATEASACLSPLLAVAACGTLMVAATTWLAHDPPPTTQHLIFVSYVPYVGFALGCFLFVTYLRKLAALADARAETIKLLEGERTRRVLHTPYRLLNELARLLRIEETRAGGADDAGPERQAHLAEAVASVREIEAIVRGTEPASSNLAADLLRLREQFADLPLILNVEDVTVDLPPPAVYRIREATRSALQNVRHHAHAGEVVVYATADSTSWLVSVHDDGCGFDPSTRRGVGLGEVVVAALEEIGAKVRVESAPSLGTLIQMTGDHTWTITPDRVSSSSTTIR